MISRRNLLKRLGLSAAAVTVAPALPKIAEAAPEPVAAVATSPTAPEWYSHIRTAHHLGVLPHEITAQQAELLRTLDRIVSLQAHPPIAVAPEYETHAKRLATGYAFAEWYWGGEQVRRFLHKVGLVEPHEHEQALLGMPRAGISVLLVERNPKLAPDLFVVRRVSNRDMGCDKTSEFFLFAPERRDETFSYQTSQTTYLHETDSWRYPSPLWRDGTAF